MLLSAVSVLVVAQSSSEIPEGLMNNPAFPRALVTSALVLNTCALLSMGTFLLHICIHHR